jgi:hypothetical protein
MAGVELVRRTYPAVAYAVTRGRDFAFFFVRRRASRRAVPAGIRAIWLYTCLGRQQCVDGVGGIGDARSSTSEQH